MGKNYFENFGSPKDKPDYFIGQSAKGYQVGNDPDTFQKIIEGIHYTIVKIVPRILIAGTLPFLLNYFLTFAGQILAIPILLLVIFESYPPSIDTLYLIDKDENQEEIYNKLLSFSKDVSEGICVYKKSFVIKNKSKLGVIRLVKTLMDYIVLNDYNKIYNAESKKEFNKRYQKILDNVQ